MKRIMKEKIGRKAVETQYKGIAASEYPSMPPKLKVINIRFLKSQGNRGNR
jgi:hypothetical protein